MGLVDLALSGQRQKRRLNVAPSDVEADYSDGAAAVNLGGVGGRSAPECKGVSLRGKRAPGQPWWARP
jgi:hypothetical protein